VVGPVWNEAVGEVDRALDPLGMNRVTDRLLNDLLLGITTVTPRARYYSFYTWVVHSIGQQKSTSFQQFRSQFYDMERAFMMACVAHEHDDAGQGRNHNAISGSEKGRRIWNESRERISMDFSYFGHRLGGYGQYYQGSISNLGLIEVPKDAAFEDPTLLGLKVAEAFDNVVDRSRLRKRVFGRKHVTKEVLAKFGKEVCLCRLRDNGAEDRDVLRGLFFGSLPGMKPNDYDIR